MTSQRSNRVRPPARLSHLTLAKLVQRLLYCPSNADEIEEWTGLSRETAYKFMRAMRDQKAAHIVAWEMDSIGRPSKPVFKLGHGADAPRNRK